MSLIVERRVLAILGSIVGAGVLTTSIVEQWRLHRWLAQASAMGISVDVSPDKFQLELRVALALTLGAICLWSKWTNRAAIVIAALSFLITVPAYFASGVFDRAEPEILLAAAVTLAIAAICFRREWSQALNTALAAIFVLINFASWLVWTERIKRSAGVRELYPHTRLNNTLYGAERWHLIILFWTLIVLIWAVRLILWESKQRKRNLTV